MNELSDKIDFPKGGPAIEVQLTYGKGKHMNSTGNYLYTAMQRDGNKAVFFATPILNQKLQEFVPQKNEWFLIRQSRNNEWDVRLSEAPASQPGISAPTGPQAATTQHGTEHTNLTREQMLALLTPDQLKTMLGLVLTANGDQPVNGHNGHSNGNGAAPPATPPTTPIPAAPWLMTGSGQYRLQFYQQAVDLVVAIRQYAAASHLELPAPTFEDIRALGTAGYIDAQNNGGRK